MKAAGEAIKMSVWTKEQLEAITARDTGIIVSAAAGSGKTSVLVERLLGILSDTENKIPADRIVVVTFTNDAAAQMKQRLSAALSEAIEKDPDNLWLCRQQALLQTAKISTIHSFCFDLIRENIQSLDVSAGFRILDDTEENLLIRKAAENTFEKLYSEAPDKINVLADFFSGSVRSDSELEEAVLKIYDFLMSIPFYDDWLKTQINYYSAGFDPDSDPLAKAYGELTKKAYEKIISRAEYAQNIFTESFGRPSNAVANDIDGISEIRAGLKKGGIFELAELHDSFSFSRIDLPRRGKNDPVDEYIEQQKEKIKKIRDDYKKEFEKIGKNIFTAEEISEDFKKHGEILSGISDIISIFSEELKKLKTAKNALGFSDAEQLAIKLLAEKNSGGEIVKTRLAKELSEYYSMIMIDEFQDANNNQDLIFKLLSKNGTADKGGTNLFVVGDVKQSIYRFRLANPQLFLDALKKSETYTGEDYSGSFASILLNRNFRSSSDVIGFVNYVFGLLMSKENGEIDYTENEALVQGLEYPDGDRTTEIIIVPDNDESTENDDGEDASSNCEARAAATKIKSMIGVKNVYDKGGLRPCEPKDFCILLRNNKSAEMYVRELEKAGIKAYAEEPAGYLKSREISVLTALLAVVDNPMQDIKLATVLMSPMFMLNAEDMAVLAGERQDRREKYFSVVRRVMGGETAVFPDSALYGKLERFMKMFEKLRYCAASQRIERFIRTIYDSTDFLSAVQVYKDGGRKRANLRLLLDVAESYEKNSGGGLNGFVRYVDNIMKRDGDFKRASTIASTDNVVSVKTIHKSKGLEYPFVFLCGTSVKFNADDLNKRIQINSDFGIGFKIQDRENLKLYDSFPRYTIKEINKASAKSEEMRLLYVALTRAREQLFITVPDNEKIRKRIEKVRSEIIAAGDVTVSTVSSADSMLDWISAAMLMHPNGDWFRDGEKIALKECGAAVNVCNADSETGKNDTAEDTAKALPDGAMLQKLRDMFAYRYDDSLTQKTAKITVTEIAKSSGGKLYLRRPDFALEYGGLTAAERGTAMHTFMQYADYNAAEGDVPAEAARLAEQGLLSFEERDSLNIGQLEEFFRSSLYARMKKCGNIRREQKFLIKKSDAALDDERLMEYNSNSMLQGIADCMFEEDGEIVLVDYKTDRVDSENVLVSRYDLQIKLYAAALGKIFGKRVREAYLYSFCLNKAVKAL